VATRRLGAWPRDSPRLVSRRFWPRPHAGHEKTDADTHVESHDDVLSDAGSTPAASTNTFEFVREFARFLLPFPPPPIFLHLRTRTWANSSPFRWRIRSIFPAISRPS